MYFKTSKTFQNIIYFETEKVINWEDRTGPLLSLCYNVEKSLTQNFKLGFI